MQIKGQGHFSGRSNKVVEGRRRSKKVVEDFRSSRLNLRGRPSPETSKIFDLKVVEGRRRSSKVEECCGIFSKLEIESPGTVVPGDFENIRSIIMLHKLDRRGQTDPET